MQNLNYKILTMNVMHTGPGRDAAQRNIEEHLNRGWGITMMQTAGAGDDGVVCVFVLHKEKQAIGEDGV